MANLDELKFYLRDEVEATTKHSTGKAFVCPLCGSGTGAHKTGAFSIDGDGTRWKCFSCGAGGDIYDLFEKRDGLTSSEAARAVMDKYGKAGARPAAAPRQAQTSPNQATPVLMDFEAMAAAEAGKLEGSAGQSYLQGRGLTLETLRTMRVGFNEREYNKSLRRCIPSVTIPYLDAQGRAIYRITRPIDEKAYDKPRNADAGTDEPLYNARALYSGADVIFIVESPICAMSVIQAGGAAVALGGTGDKKLLGQLKKEPTKAALALALDNDPANEAEPEKGEQGQKAQARLAESLTAAGIFFLQANIAGEYKDPNDRLQHDAEGLRAAISTAIGAAEFARNAEKRAALEDYQQESAAGCVEAFRKTISDSLNTPAIPTGYKGLDNLLEGGLYDGLYILGAISSLGKTTFALQMADQIAAAGQDVIIFSLEMARNELIAKSISRLTYRAVLNGTAKRSAAKTTRGITAGIRYAKYGDEEMQLIDGAINTYADTISGHIWILEGVGDMGAAQVRTAVARHISLMGRKPVVIIDYLQILAPYEIRATDKQNTDKAVLELKRISRDYKIPVIGISSFNRDNYSAPVNMAAFKESGAIEYSSDVLIGLQYQGMDYQDGEADKAREKRIRDLIKKNEAQGRAGEGQEIELKVLKNRNGGRGTSDPLTFYPMFNCFVEHPEGFSVTSEEGGAFGSAARKRL